MSMTNFEQYKMEFERGNTGATTSDDYKRLTDLRYEQKDNSEITIKFVKKSFCRRYEIWKPPSEEVSIKDNNSINYCIVLKNDKTYNHYASLIGNPAQWAPYKDKVYWGKHQGGLYEFEYGSERDVQTGFKKRHYKYLFRPEYKEFFKRFAFGGAPYNIGDLPISPSLRYHTAIFVSGDPLMEETKTLRWISISHKLFLQLCNFDNNNFDLDHFWFKLKKQGSGRNTQYLLTPDTVATEKLNKLYSLDEYQIPNLELTTQVSSDFYLWKYFKSDFIEGDAILGTNYADLVEKGYKEYLEKNSNIVSENESSYEKTKTIVVPRAVKESISSASEDISNKSTIKVFATNIENKIPTTKSGNVKQNLPTESIKDVGKIMSNISSTLNYQIKDEDNDIEYGTSSYEEIEEDEIPF